MVENQLDNTQEIISVSEINKRAKSILEENFPFVWIQGEVSNFFSAASGHWYFSLKDESSEIRCAMFTNKNHHITFEPKDGDHLVLNGTLSIFEGRGQYQIIVEHIELAGEGALLKAFEELKKKLQLEGLFDDSIKRQLPAYPKNIAVVTSPDGAVIQDIINVLDRRSPFLDLTVVPTLVQGEKAAPLICDALNKVGKLKNIDVVILARGGGSIEDLWAFNNEEVARAIVNCPTPIISAIGHETDFTISDFVSDLRAPTPSIAAEIISQPYSELIETLEGYQNYISRSVISQIDLQRTQITNLIKRIRHPGDKLREISQKLDYIETTLIQNINQEISFKKNGLNLKDLSLQQNSPQNKVKEAKVYLQNASKDLLKALKLEIERKNTVLAEIVATLQAVSPLSVLSRGYSIISTEPDGKILSSSNQVEIGQSISAILSKGSIKAEIKSKNENEE
ncbi:MAG: exodeoxyribonuclease VII large subunit [SAR86 cluster bacterium]|jgi:exodeoxyribonuclease VII large subunit|nr:exodeoxyribonuclease VII large subunit [SAR86 cluster bacterium]